VCERSLLYKGDERELQTHWHAYLHPVTGAAVFLFLYNLPPWGSLAATSRSSTVLGVSLDTPIKDVVVLIALPNKEVSEELAQVRIIGFVIKAEGAGVVQKDPKLVGEPAAEDVRRGGHLLLHDAIIFLLLGGSLQALPGKSATEEIH